MTRFPKHSSLRNDTGQRWHGYFYGIFETFSAFCTELKKCLRKCLLRVSRNVYTSSWKPTCSYDHIQPFTDFKGIKEMMIEENVATV